VSRGVDVVIVFSEAFSMLVIAAQIAAPLLSSPVLVCPSPSVSHNSGAGEQPESCFGRMCLSPEKQRSRQCEVLLYFVESRCGAVV
jgi:hypothetical protein